MVQGNPRWREIQRNPAVEEGLKGDFSGGRRSREIRWMRKVFERNPAMEKDSSVVENDLSRNPEVEKVGGERSREIQWLKKDPRKSRVIKKDPVKS